MIAQAIVITLARAQAHDYRISGSSGYRFFYGREKRQKFRNGSYTTEKKPRFDANPAGVIVSDF